MKYCIALLSFLVCNTVQVARADRPNVVVIMGDDIGYSDIGCFGGEISTPNLDALAENGLRFTNFYSENMCWVSRAAMLTGVHHKTSMVNGALHPRCTTLPETLRAAGYRTMLSGKWHLAGKNNSVYPNDRGFEEFYGILGGASSFYAPYSLSRNRKNVEHEASDDPDYYFTNAISDEAVRWIKAVDAKQPLFLNLAYTAAHWPLHAPDDEVRKYAGEYAAGWDQLRAQRLARMKRLNILPQGTPLSPRNPKVPSWKDEKHKAWQQRRMEVYAAQISIMDAGIGRVFDALKSTGRWNNTLVFFTVDNGGCHVEYGVDRKGSYLPKQTRDGRAMRPGNIPGLTPGPENTYQSYGHGWANASNTPYRLYKQYDHEGGIRTPMIAHWPQGIDRRGSINTSVSHLVDILPTVLDACEVTGKVTKIPSDGRSLAAAFRGAATPEHKSLFFHHAKGRALRMGPWKIVSQSKKNWELYHLGKDPLELNDLAQANPMKLQELKAVWRRESERHKRQADLAQP